MLVGYVIVRIVSCYEWQFALYYMHNLAVRVGDTIHYAIPANMKK